MVKAASCWACASLAAASRYATSRRAMTVEGMHLQCENRTRVCVDLYFAAASGPRLGSGRVWPRPDCTLLQSCCECVAGRTSQVHNPTDNGMLACDDCCGEATSCAHVYGSRGVGFDGSGPALKVSCGLGSALKMLRTGCCLRFSAHREDSRTCTPQAVVCVTHTAASLLAEQRSSRTMHQSSRQRPWPACQSPALCSPVQRGNHSRVAQKWSSPGPAQHSA